MSLDFKPMLKPVDLSGDCAAERPRASMSPVAGFWPRAAAFLLDIALLLFVFSLVANYAYAVLYPARWAAQALAPVVIFVYFWIGSSRLAQGRTLGKWTLGLRTVALDGGPLDLAPAAARAAALQLAVAFCAVALAQFQNRQLFHIPNLSLGALAGILALSALGASYVAAGSVLCGLHPKKRTLHDLLVGSLVARDGREEEACAFVADFDSVCVSRQKLAVYPAVVIAVIPFVFVGQVFWGLRADFPTYAAPFAAARARLDAPGFRLVSLVGPSIEGRERFRKAIEQLEATQKASVEAGATEKAREQERWIEMVRKYAPTGRKFIFGFDCDALLTSETLVATPAYQAIRVALPEEAAALDKAFYSAEDGAALPYDALQIECVETLPLYLYAKGRFVWREVLPVGDGASSATLSDAP